MPYLRGDHDRTPAVLDRAPAASLADDLARLRLNGAIFLHGMYTEPWAYESVPGADAATILAGAERVILFHVVASGRTWIELDGHDRLWANAGDVIVLPYGDTHRMGGSLPAACAAMASLLPMPPWSELPVVRLGQGGPRTDLVCGYLSCDDPLFDPRIRALPPAFVVSPGEGPACDWVRASIQFVLAQTTIVGADHIEAPVGLTESLFIEVLKMHLTSAPAAERGLLGAIRDSVVGPALGAMHAAPERRWTVDALAQEARSSASVLDERFRTLLGLAPIRYLAQWRMHVAGGLLRSSDLPVATVARQVGYESEEAFSRAFKRARGASPSIWRTRR